MERDKKVGKVTRAEGKRELNRLSDEKGYRFSRGTRTDFSR